MNSIYKLLSIAALALTSLTAAGQAPARLLATQSRIGDTQGSTDGVTMITSYFYDAFNRPVRAAAVAVETDGREELNVYTRYTYDEAGRLLVRQEDQAQATTPENVDHEFIFSPRTRYVNTYDSEGRLTRADRESYNAKKDTWTNMGRDEYDYDSEGRVAVQRNWISGVAAYNEATPTNTTTFAYDDQGRRISGHNDGAYSSNKYDISYTYDSEGRLIKEEWVRWEATQKNRVQTRYTYTYEGSLMTCKLKETGVEESLKDSNGNIVKDATGKVVKVWRVVPASRTIYSLVDGNADRVRQQDETWYAPSQEWKKQAGSEYISEYRHYDSAADLAPAAVTAAVADGTQADIQVGFNVSAAAAAQKPQYLFFRDGYLVMTKTLEELEAEGGYDAATGRATATLKRQKSGSHEVFVQAALPDGQGGYTPLNVSESAAFSLSITCPAVKDLRVTGIKEKVHHVAGTGDTPDHDEYSYDITVEWTNPSADDMAYFGFKRHDLYLNQIQMRVASTSTPTAQKLTVTEDENHGKFCLRTFYDLGEAQTDTIEFSPENLNRPQPIAAYGWIPGAMSQTLAKVNLADPTAAPEKLWNLYDSGYEDVSQIAAGTGAGQYYYALYQDENWMTRFAAFNFKEQTITNIGKAIDYGQPLSNGALAYDSASATLYASSYVYDDNYEPVYGLYSVDPATAEATKLAPLALDFRTMAAADGKLYAVGMGDDYASYHLYAIDLSDYRAEEVVFAEPITEDYYDAVSLTATGGKLYLTLGNYLFTIDPAQKTYTKSANMGYSLLGTTLAFADQTPEIKQSPEEKRLSRLPVRTVTYGDVMGMLPEDTASGETLYFYDTAGRLLRETTTSLGTDGLWSLDYYTKHETADGQELGKTRYQWGICEYDFTGFSPVEATNYAYDAEGRLARTENGDDWTAYTYNADGLKETETTGCGDETYTVHTYYYKDGAAQPYRMVSDAPAHPEWTGDIFTETYTYSEAGLLTKATRLDANGPIQKTEYEYFEGTDIRSRELRSGFDQSSKAYVPELETASTMVDGDANRIESRTRSYFEGTWYDEPASRRLDEYTDFSAYAANAGQLDMAFTATADADSLNTAVLTFALPQIAYSAQVDFDIYRDGQVIKSIPFDELTRIINHDDMTVTIRDAALRNGSHEWFVAPKQQLLSEMGDKLGEARLPISAIKGLDFQLELPAATDLRLVSGRDIYIDDQDNEVSDPSRATSTAKAATVSWTNPEHAADYKFLCNQLYIQPKQLPEAEFKELDTCEAEARLRFADEFDLYIQSRYAYGYVNSEPLHIVASTITGIDAPASAGGLSIAVSGSTATTTAPATIMAFDAAGRLIAKADNASSLSLGAASGIVVIVAKTATETQAVKTRIQ